MLYNSKKYIKNLLCLSLIAVIFISVNIPPQAYADTGPGRIRTCSASGNVSGLENGLDGEMSNGVQVIRSDDLVIDFDNAVCQTQLGGLYATVKLNIGIMNSICATGSSVRVTPSILQDTLDVAKAVRNNISKPTGACTGAIAGASAAIANFVVVLEIMYQIADDVYKNSRICGDGWIQPNSSLYEISTPGEKQKVIDAVNASIAKLEAGETLDPEEQLQLETNQNYRQWYYDGVEVRDNPYGYSTITVPTNVNSHGIETTDYDFGASPCLDPTQGLSDYPRQRYYLKGSSIGNFNCGQYLIQEGQNDPFTNEVITPVRLSDFRRAYSCCQERRKNYICIDYGGKKTFCKAGRRCNLYNSDNSLFITFEAIREDSNLICAQTYSTCPYNFSIGGGTTKYDAFQDGIKTSNGWDMITLDEIESENCAGKSEVRRNDCSLNEKAGKYRNYCQILRHCTMSDTRNYVYTSDLDSPYFSSACMNFTGDSRNQNTYNGGRLFGSQRHFSAPIAQCFKETIENLFYNRFGHSQCLTNDVSPSAEGICSDGNYQTYQSDSGPQYKQGELVSDRSFFQKIQDNLRLVVKLAITFAVIFYGANLLLGGGGIKKADILKFLLKMGLVMYFAVGTAWQDKFFDGVYNASNELSQIVFKIDVSPIPEQRDGCQFGDITTANATIVSSESAAYPKGKEYLALWDTLDCKIARYLGFGPTANVANIASLIAASLLSGPYGLYFSLAIMFFGFFFIAATIRALHIFLSSAMGIIVLIFLSPAIIPTVLFKKTNNLFKGWLSNLIGFCLQPVLLFAYIAIFITIMDKTLIGSATFHGNGPNKTIVCSQYCADANGYKVPTEIDDTCTEPGCNANVDEECDDPGNVFIDPLDNSFACLININDFGKFPGFEIVGITIPVLETLFSGNITEKVLTILKAAIIMYLLCQFMDQIPGIASYIVGGASLSGGPSVMGRATGLMGKTMGMSAALQKRARRGGTQAAKKIKEMAAERLGGKK